MRLHAFIGLSEDTYVADSIVSKLFSEPFREAGLIQKVIRLRGVTDIDCRLAVACPRQSIFGSHGAFVYLGYVGPAIGEQARSRHSVPKISRYLFFIQLVNSDPPGPIRIMRLVLNDVPELVGQYRHMPQLVAFFYEDVPSTVISEVVQAAGVGSPQRPSILSARML